MRTPAGKECEYFYGDYHRGRSHEECRLLGASWSPKLCQNCPVPEILLANACKHQYLTGTVKNTFLIFGPRVHISAYCKKCSCDVKEPRIGCGQCHPLPPIFTGE